MYRFSILEAISAGVGWVWDRDYLASTLCALHDIWFSCAKHLDLSPTRRASLPAPLEKH